VQAQVLEDLQCLSVLEIGTTEMKTKLFLPRAFRGKWTKRGEKTHKSDISTPFFKQIGQTAEKTTFKQD
jgi:hypothetical protein